MKEMNKKTLNKEISFIDLFAGLGGTRIGFEQACINFGIVPRCVFTSEIKEHAIETYKKNFKDHNVKGDITKINAADIPNFDILLGGFPCQAFSFSGKRRGFADTRGTLFFDIERILKEKNPSGFILENVEGLVVHDRLDLKDKVGRTLQTIIAKLEALNYKVSWKLLNAANFGVPQNRKRVYIVGSKKGLVKLDNLEESGVLLEKILEKNKETINTDFVVKLLKHYKPYDLYGKSIKDKRGGKNNIHSWNIGLKGEVTAEQAKLLELILCERRKKKWAIIKKIKWMDGMPLTLSEISTFYGKQLNIKKPALKNMLADLDKKGYLVYEHPKDIVVSADSKGNMLSDRRHSFSTEKGYNIVSGKLSFEISKILDPKGIAPTLVATDMSRLAVVDGKGFRRLTIREGLRLFGFPESYNINFSTQKAYDLIGNSIVVPVVRKISEKLLQNLIG